MPRRRRQGSTDRRDRIQKVISRFRSSGMSQRAFAEAHSIPLSTFSYWLRNHIEPVEPTLVPVHVARARPSTTPIDILLPNDVVVRIAGDCDPSVLTNVLRAIDAAC